MSPWLKFDFNVAGSTGGVCLGWLWPGKRSVLRAPVFTRTAECIRCVAHRDPCTGRTSARRLRRTEDFSGTPATFKI